MVTTLLASCTMPVLFAADQAKPLLVRLDPQSRASLLAALAGMIVLAFGFMVLAYLGARYVKRIARQRPPKRRRDTSDWDRRFPVERFPPQQSEQP